MNNERIVDFTQVKETSFIDKEGVYTFTIKKYEPKINSNEKPYDRYFIESVDGEAMMVDFYIQENALFRYKAFLSALGVDVSIKSIDLNTLPQTLIGKIFIGTVKRRAPQLDLLTGDMVESKYFDIVKFAKA